MTTCAQLVYTSASRTLEGPGFGVVQLSPDWPAAVGDSRATLGPLISLGTGESFGLRHAADGRIAYRTVPAGTDAFGRPGNHLVHLLWDGDGRLTPRDVLAFRSAGGFLDGLPVEAEPSREMPAVEVPSARRSLPPLTAEDVDALVPAMAAVLAAVAAGAGVVGLPARTASGRDVAELVFGVLPRAMASAVALHVGTASVMGDAGAVRVHVDAGPDVTSDVVPDGQDTARARALLEAAAKKELCSDQLRKLETLDRWLFTDTWTGLDPAALTPTQLVGVLESEKAGWWLSSPDAVDVACAVAASAPEVEAALRAALERHPDVWDRLRDRELDAALTAVFSGAGRADVPIGFTGLTRAELCEAFTAELARGRRLPEVGGAAAALVEESVALPHPVVLLELTDDLAGLARLATSRPVVREALVREWAGVLEWPASSASLLGHLLLEDPDWFLTLGGSTPPSVVRAALPWAAERLAAPMVERLAVTVAASELAGQGWALRDVLFRSGLAEEEVAAIVARNFLVLAGDDGWPGEVARLTAGALGAGDGGEAPEGRRKTGMWPRRRR
ncbi:MULTISPECIES: GAP1-N2 domain-containing protein [unclassified Modestobacter]|uniref:GAP1-N2 domain-containing protein n=1 Tax=unclassified Modestobacter TaxID=2643866 RepID=UPI0022AAFFF1|nr:MULTISPECIES: hypothetical protein [unclassified Modestobacter]MCZ2826658.1 hypothetical protein [Modestobacter sp. VKM Ac-2981]MCZ2855038.1 hypothetical protein [Modestobacter sp. VKM Ac-2982]